MSYVERERGIRSERMEEVEEGTDEKEEEVENEKKHVTET